MGRSGLGLPSDVDPVWVRGLLYFAAVLPVSGQTTGVDPSARRGGRGARFTLGRPRPARTACRGSAEARGSSPHRMRERDGASGGERDEDLRREGRTRTMRAPSTATGRRIGLGGIVRCPQLNHDVTRRPPGARERSGSAQGSTAARPGREARLETVRKVLTKPRKPGRRWFLPPVAGMVVLGVSCGGRERCVECTYVVVARIAFEEGAIEFGADHKK